MSEEVVLIGAGGHAKVVFATLRSRGVDVVGVYDDRSTLWGEEFCGQEVSGPLEKAQGHERPAVIAIGSNRDRARVADRLTLDWATVVHPRAWIDPSVRLGPGTVVFAGAVVQPDTEIGAHAIVNTGARIDHDCRIGDFAHIAPGVALAGEGRVGSGALLGIGSSVIPGIIVGDWSVVGAGAAVVKDVMEKTTVAGVPAREIRGA